MIDFSVRQISFLSSDDYNPSKLQAIARHFQIGNSRACLFCLYYIYDLEGYQGPKWKADEPKQVKSVFLPFLPQQLTKAEAMAKGLGINLGELCKRAIYETSKQLEYGKLDSYHPKVIEFFK